MTTPPATFAQPAAGHVRPPVTGLAGLLIADVTDVIKRTAQSDPRSLQAAVGPSEIGVPCVRRLAYKILDWPAKPNSDTDPWASVIGTAVHTWMAETYGKENRRLGRERYLIERRVWVPGPVYGNSDLYDRDRGVVIDWKVPGTEQMKKYRKGRPGDQYEKQAHIYGLGRQLAGETPEHVAIVFLPRAGRLDGMHVWSEPYSPATAVEAMQRYQATRDAAWSLDPAAHPDHWALFPTADAYCTYCPFYLPGSTDLGKGCPGHTTPKEK